ncbi:MAG: hypothetical protein LBS49_10595 [Candidatus Accumulibacter sp.]|jgi:hypothetical protein|nr:hypothetical protein [Accumulibacter sp.]
MPDASVSPLRSAFDLPFEEQIAFFRQKLHLPTERWDDIWQSAHDRSFVVAGAMKADLLQDLFDAVAPLQRQSQESLTRKFLEAAEKNNWHGWTGEDTEEGQAWRARVVYETNIRTSYAAGRYAQLTDPDLVALRPYWKYVHSDLSWEHPRPMHKLWGDMQLTLRHDDPFWQTHYPPNGWGCRCRVVAVRQPEDGAAAAPPPGWDTVNPKTGAPAGIDKGWAYAPGATRAEEIRAFVATKAGELSPELAQAFVAEVQKIAPELASPQFEPQKTAAAAASWLTRNNLVREADYTGLATEVANAMNATLLAHVQDYPEIKRKLNFVGTTQARAQRYADLRIDQRYRALVGIGISPDEAKKTAEAKRAKFRAELRTPGNVYATAINYPGLAGIAVNRVFGKNLRAFVASARRDERTGYHPPGTGSIGGIMNHEMGHVMDFLLNLSQYPDMIALYDQYKDRLEKEVSRYAANHGLDEFIAECWTEYKTSPAPRTAARAVGSLVEARYRSRFPR